MLAQITSDDLLISRQQYEKLKYYQQQYQQQQAVQLRYDSLQVLVNELNLQVAREIEARRIIGNTADYLEGQNIDLQRLNTRLNSNLLAMRNSTNKYRFKYEQSASSKKYVSYAFVWAGLMSAAFFISLHDDYKQEAYWGMLGSSAAAVTLAITISKRTKKGSSQE